MHTTDQLNIALAGRYAIERQVGAGGMATVYLARDLRHDRQVALKVLKPELGAVLGVERFLAEIKVTANLQHPNLLPLFDSGEAAGLLFYVMPFVEGESLRARLQREKQIPVDEAVQLGVAVAGALDYAHRHGVIHRDLKPENILIHEGQPLVADFGIALAVSNAGADRITQTGLSLGTPQYMSPEQATGDRTIDGRTDVYSLGAVLYEMLTGDPPHVASTAQAVIAKVLTDVPRNVRVSRPSVPDHVARALDHALEKIPADRFATAREMADSLLGRGPALDVRPELVALPSKPAAPARLAKVLPWAIAAMAVVVAGLTMLRQPAARRPIIVSLETPDSAVPRLRYGGGRMIAISPDGYRIAWIGSADRQLSMSGPASSVTTGPTRLYMRTLGDPTPRALPGTDHASCPEFSPDGASLLYESSDHRLFRLSLATGAAVPVIDSTQSCATWGDKGSILVERSHGIWRLPSAGGQPKIVATGDPHGGRLANPSILPGERYAIATLTGAGLRELVRVDLSSGRVERTGLKGINGRFSRPDRLLYARTDGSLVAVTISPRDGRISGEPQIVASGLALQPGASAQFAASDEGTLIGLFGAPIATRRLVAVDVHGTATRLSAEQRYFGWVRVSPDGNRAAFEIAESPAGPWDEWVMDLRSSTLSRLTTGATGIRTAGWSRDGRSVIFLAPRVGADLGTQVQAPKAVVALPWDRGGALDTLFRGGTEFQYADVGPPHGLIVLAQGKVAVQTRLFVAPLDSPSAVRPLTGSGSAAERNPRVSRDGRWVTFSSDESGRTEVYVSALSPGGGRVQVSVSGGEEPVWDPTAFAVFYRGPQRMMRATLTAAPELRVVQRDSLFEDRFYRSQYAYDVFPDGKRFLMIEADAASFQTMLYLNWPQLLTHQPSR